MMSRQLMKTLFRCCALLSLVLAALALAGCSPPADPEPAATPPPDAPPAARAPALSAEAQAALDDFVNQQQTIDAEWGRIHADFDQWRAGLTACHPGARHEALNEFAVAFNAVTKPARDITRAQSTRELADLLITAAEGEAAALRQLRDHWQPGNVALFEQVEQRRAQAYRAQKNAQDQAIALEAMFADGSDSAAAQEFAQAFEAVTTDWQQIHDGYAALRQEAESAGAAAVYAELERLAASLTLVVDALAELTPPDGAASEIAQLRDAAKAELEAFAAARETAPEATASEGKAAEEMASEQPASEQAPAADAASAETAADTDTATDAPALPDFDAIDAVVQKSADALQAAGDAVSRIAAEDTIPDIDPEQGRAELQVFNDEYRSLLKAWDDFHDRYDQWRSNEGGCDRSEVAQSLEQFRLRIGALGRDVRDLPQSGYLRPMYTLLVDAVAAEENAFRTLTLSWQPFTVDPFQAVAAARVNADGLRREAARALQELRERF